MTRTLKIAGVDRIFTLSGNQIMPIFDAGIDCAIDLVHVRHEAAAVYMADAWAQLSDDIGVALVTAGPGFANALSPLYSAMAAESPVLLLSGDSPLTQDGVGAFQELAQTDVSSPMVKTALRCSNAVELGNNIANAIQIAKSGRPGPAHLALPFDLLNEDVGQTELPMAHQFVPEVVTLGQDAIAKIIKFVTSAKTPLILVGPAQSRSHMGNVLQALAQKLDVPVITIESPRGLNDPALGSFTKVLPEVDVVLCIGKKTDFTIAFANSPPFNENCKFVVIEPDAESLNRAKNILGDRLVIGVLADVKAGIVQLIQSNVVNASNRQLWREAVCGAIATRTDTTRNDTSKRIHPAKLCQAVQHFLNETNEPILVVDGGEFGQWAQAYVSPPTRIINGPSGAIGGGLCYALAAKLNREHATVIAMMGDGTVGFHLSEFDTALRYDVPFVAIIGNDARWNAEVQIQLRDYGKERLIGCELNATRYDLAVKGLGGHGEYVTTLNELRPALERAFDSGLPACINVEIEGLAAP